MYGEGNAVLGTTAVAATTYGVTTLPNTGSDMLVQIAIAVAAGVFAWGVLYVRQARRNNSTTA